MTTNGVPGGSRPAVVYKALTLASGPRAVGVDAAGRREQPPKPGVSVGGNQPVTSEVAWAAACRRRGRTFAIRRAAA